MVHAVVALTLSECFVSPTLSVESRAGNDVLYIAQNSWLLFLLLGCFGVHGV
jgi:hypothetical protein